MLEFPYRRESLRGPPPPSLSHSATYRLRPMAAVRVFGPGGRSRYFTEALLDSGSADVVFPWMTVTFIGASLFPTTGHQLRWHGTAYPLRFANVEMEFATAAASCRWPAIVGFTSAPLKYPLLGVTGCLEFFDATFRGEDRLTELAPNGSFPGTLRLAP